MGRPLKKGLQYFNIDCNQEDNLTYIEAKHGIVGYGIVIKIWRKIYMINGYYADWNEKNIYLFAREINVSPATILEVVESCFDENIFDRKLFNKYQILTSKGIQRRYIKIVTEAKRKDTEIEEKFDLLSLTPENISFPPEETQKTPEESTQSKVKESKVNKSNGLPAQAPVPGKSGKSKKEKREEPPEPFWEKLIEVWFCFGIDKFKVKPSFERDDPRILKRIVHRLKKRAEDKKIEWNEESGPRRLGIFLEMAYSDKWLSENFLLSNLEKQFDKVIQNQSSKKVHSESVADLQYLYERFCEGELDHRLITPKHFEELSKSHKVRIDQGIIQIRKRSLLGSNIFSETELFKDYESGKSTPATEADKVNLKRIAVIEYFKKLKGAQVPAA